MNPEMTMVVRRNEEREALRSVIQQWNANRLDLFELSEPNENLEFHGVMRFYFQDSGQKVATKCIRVASDATAQNVVETLIEKFRPDMRMLSLPEYALFEIHENGEERKLSMDEKPLLVQLNWHKDDREGRFLLRRLDDKTNMPSNTFQQDGSSFKRKLSKREKKQLKKQEKLNRIKSVGTSEENDAKVAEKLYTELPETSFTRSISNPEAVMRRRRQQQERKLQQYRSKDGGPDTGGTLKIYGESLCRDVPYKTLLLSIRDTAQQVVKEMLIKYGLDKEDPHNYCLVQVNGCNEHSKENSHQNNNNNNTVGLNNQEYILDDDECPLAILMTQSYLPGSIMFHVRRRPADYHPRKRKKKPQNKWNQQQSSSNEMLEYRYEDGFDRLPFFLELNPDGSEMNGGAARRHRLHPNVTEVGCERNISQTQSQSQYLQLFGPNILPRHCVIANTEGIVTVTPCSRDSETYVNGSRIYETTILRNGSVVKFGRIHCFRFLDPFFEERIRQRQDSLRSIHEYGGAYDRQSTPRDDTHSQNSASTVAATAATTDTKRNSSTLNTTTTTAAADSQLSSSHNFETTFDVEGNIETRSTSSHGGGGGGGGVGGGNNNKEDSHSQRSIGSGSKDGMSRIAAANTTYHRAGTDAILPAVLEIKEETEETLLNEVITSLDPTTPSFKLAPAYCLYLMARYRASTLYRPELTLNERAHRLTIMLAKVASIIQKVIQERCRDIRSLALWLANSSELLFFLQFDRHLFAFSKDSRRILAESVQISFRYLVGCVQSELSTVMPLFFADKDDTSHDSEESPTVLGVLGSAMNLLRRYRVNVALTVQLFSHLFHFINVWSFNRLIAPNTIYCSRLWGLRLKARLAQIEAWAERQGLEISTDTHLAKIVQAAHLLQAPKYTAEDLASLTSSCFLLNSLQLRTFLMKYQPAPDEPPLPREHIDNVIKVAESLADEFAKSDGKELKLEEDPEFALEFVLPIDSYSCEVVRGIPPGLVEFVAPLQSMGLCRLSTQPSSNGLWTVYMELPNVKSAMMRSPSAMSNRSVGYLLGPQEPEIQTIYLHKSTSGMGLSIVAAKGAGQDRLGIYIKSVVKGGAADADGRLSAGDQLLKVDGQSLIGVSQEKAAEFLVRTGPIVTLEVAKQGAIYHGLATLLSQPSPVMTRGGRRMSERDLPSRVMHEHANQATQLPMHAPIHSSKSVPSLNSPCGVDGQIVSAAVASRSAHEVYNSGYTSNVSPASVTHHQHSAALRSRSSQNLNDSRSLSSYSQNVSGTLPNRQTSNPNLLQNASAVSPAYPPHYNHLPPPPPPPPSSQQQQQHQQHPMYHQHVQQQQMLMHQQQQQQQYQYSMHNSSTDSGGERFYQNLNVYRNQELQNGGSKVMSSPHDRNSNQFQRNFRGSQNSLQAAAQPGRQSMDTLPSYLRDRPSSAYMQKENLPPMPTSMSARSQSTRDMMRQEAKLQEMSEEVRRREMRASMSPSQPPYHVGPAASRVLTSADNQETYGPPYNHRGTNANGAYPPPTADVHAAAMRSPYASHFKNGPLHPTMEEIGYRESPPPPPPPPTSTHPLYQLNSTQRVPDNRYNASVGDAPKGGYYPSSPVATASLKHYQLQGTNPWEREEREKEAERKREAVKEWRDQQISELLSLGPNRNQIQDEQLRALKLEKEFERRAQEEDEEDDEDHEAAGRIQDVMRAARQQDDFRNKSGGGGYMPQANANRWANSHAQMNGGVAGRFQQTSQILEEKERLRRLKDMKMKQVEQEALKMEENQLKMKEEENTSINNGHVGGGFTKPLNRPSHLKLDLSGGGSPSTNHASHSSSLNNSYAENQPPCTVMPQQRLDNLLEHSNTSATTAAPPPPERGSSFAVMSQALRSPTATSYSANASKSDISQTSVNNASNALTPKKVSFQETASEIISSNNTPVEKVFEDPNRFLSEAEAMLASPKSPDTQFLNSTPGVIGTQEVYKDPRQKRLAEQQHQKLMSNKVTPVPEKLTFKEKMKMFAMETGEEGTPKDKVKISRAQRDIDNINSPAGVNANNKPSNSENGTIK